jgi:serine/threonine protein kinase
MAPEIIQLWSNPELPKEKKIKGSYYGTGVDIWALGVMIFGLFTGRESPFDESNDKEILDLHLSIIEDEPSFEHAAFEGNPDAVDFIKECLIKDPAKRPEAIQLMDHPWIVKFNSLCQSHSVV